MPQSKPYSLPKQERLSSLSAVRRLFADGKSGFVFPFRYMTLTENSTSPSVEVLFSVPKRNHKRANKRNLLRRRTKEAFRLSKSVLHTFAEAEGVNVDIAFVYSSKELLSYNTIAHAVRKIMAEVVEHR